MNVTLPPDFQHSYVIFLLLLGVCLILIWAYSRIIFNRKSSSTSENNFDTSALQKTVTEQQFVIARLEQQLIEHQNCLDRHKLIEAALAQERQQTQTLRLSEQATRLNAQSQQRALEEKIEWLSQSEARLKTLFENISYSCLEKNAQSAQMEQKKSLMEILLPLKEQLDSFQSKIQEKFQHESKERHLLSYELSKIQELNSQLSQDATNLTQALLGNQKVQGTWGEVILEHALEASGLRKDHEYKLQVSLSKDVGERIQPDAIVYLPNGRTVIVDAKVSLTAYTRYVNDPEQKKSAHLSEHILSIKTHIKRLGKKSYHQAAELNTLDFVLLFVPLEPALSLSLQHAPTLLQEAQSQNIMLVSPSTLLIALRTIQNLWQTERQTKYASVIASKASQLFDKFRLFLESFQSIGASLERAQSDYHVGLSRLSQGKGNIIRQIEAFKKLGINVQKSLPEIDTEHMAFSEEDPDSLKRLLNDDQESKLKHSASPMLV